MDQGLKYMVSLYVGIFLVVGVFAFSTDRRVIIDDEMTILDTPTAAQDVELASGMVVETEELIDPHLNVIQFESSHYRSTTQTGFGTLIKKSGLAGSTDLDTHQPFNEVRFESAGQPLVAKTKSGDRSAHQALNVVRFGQEPHRALNVVKFETNPHQAFNEVGFEKEE